MNYWVILFSLLTCAYAQSNACPDVNCTCTANVLDFTSTATCSEANWLVQGDLNIADGRILNIGFNFITINGSLNLLGTNSTLRYSVDFEGRFGYINITSDAKFGNGKLVVDFKNMPVGIWSVFLANYRTRSVGFGTENLFLFPEAEKSCRQLLGDKNPAIRYEATLSVAINITMDPSCSLEPCIINPRTASCVDFNMPDPQKYIDMLCSQMPNMPGCSIQSICQNDPDLRSSTYCSDISVLRTICTDMPGMKGCADLRSMCQNGSVVAQCQTPIFSVPSTMDIIDAMTSICTSHHMDGCDMCSDNFDCDLLMVYSEMCHMMPNMDECAAWVTMCENSEAASWPMCKFSSTSAGVNHFPVAALLAIIMAFIAL